MLSHACLRSGALAVLLTLSAMPSFAQSFRVQCPSTTNLHPTALPAGASEPAYNGPSFTGQTSQPTKNINGAIKCQQISGGDGYATMADGTQTYLFSFGPLSGLADIRNGLPGTEFAAIFNTLGDPRTNPAYNGAVGQVPDPDSTPNPGAIDGHVDPRPIMDIGVMNGNIPAPTMAIDEDDEFFLTLTNVGMIMRPDLFEQHTVHFHGYPNASSFYDGVPDASVAINIGASFTYYYLAPDAGTYFWHCHITPPEHLQMGMVGQIFVRPRQNRVPGGTSLYSSLVQQQNDPRTMCGTDILCSTPLPPSNGVLHVNNKSGTPTLYAYNDGDGSTAYDVEYPVQIHGFDPNFHFVGMTFNPEPFTDMKDKYFLLNGRSYPDTVTQGPMQTPVADGTKHYSQPLPALINIPSGGRALLRISDLDVTEFQTLASLGIPMHVIGVNARLLRDLSGNDMTYFTNSVTLGGGESVDVILDASDTTRYAPGSVFYLYTPNLDHLSNDAENFGGLMTEVHICHAVDPTTKACS
ncbi:multicopper oxidase domain-containing protein [Paraburkholderia dinghuensis]|uniref:Multicopper oxidase family protein n=1 Tax=Paraburkholderia dinghuensis TaxID=2305225 RepID=A0A3N6NAV7_9BURK|nr:multicopper oxidase family protein [Paraburkholderia dinghuensis]RQH05467.1 multicopper oxidase family protein [Paraburkholderia dinghuensis]